MDSLKYSKILFAKAEEFTGKLKKIKIDSEVLKDSIREFSIKISVYLEDKQNGKVSIYYKPTKNSFSIVTNEVKGKELISKIENCWSGKTEPDDGYNIYVDGSHKNDSIGYGFVVVKDGEAIEKKYGKIKDHYSESSRNIVGEIEAVRHAILWAKKHKIESIAIFYDYTGLEKWATHEWKTNLQLTKEYVEFMDSCKVKIKWNKISGHSGDKWNTEADRLARLGVE